MAFTASPTFPGDFHDGALRLAADATSRRAAAPVGEASAAWRQMLELGWQGVLVAEADDGVGGSLADMAALVEALASHALPAPLVSRAAVAPALLARVPGQRELLASIAAGEASVCPVLQSAGDLRLDATGHLRGLLRGADLGEPASHLLFDLPAAGATPALLVLLSTDGLQARMRRYTGIDDRATVDVDLDGLALDDRAVVLRGDAVGPAVRQARRVGGVLSCVQAVAASGAMVEQTIEYLNTRQQFGVALATFQALRHRLVDMYVAYENARGLVRRMVGAAPRLADDAADRDVALLQLYVHGVSRQAAEGAIQLHGGMGMTLETPAARLALHALACALAFGDKARWLDGLAAGMARDLAGAAQEA